MTRDEFNELLKTANLSKKDFAEYLGTSYNTVNAWGSSGRDVPYWVKSWIELYICCRNGEKLQTLIKENVCEDLAKFGSKPLSLDD
jgi:DNA-binding XRE family transcriptional regulator